jgi:hypothetical protein
MIAVAKRGSAKIITPAADWIRCAQVREPTTRKKASWILRCSQMMPVSPQNTSRWPRSEDKELKRRQHSLDHGPGRRIPPPPLFRRVERLCPPGSDGSS